MEALFRDLLIGVTSFFRDPEAFEALEEQIVPKLFADKLPGASIRVWSNGCSTGEEAYSIAILLQEKMESLHQNFSLQIFATDIDPQAIATARAGIYPASIAADISPKRLARFFTVEQNGNAYRIHKNIRDCLVFSEHDVIKDPPFSKLDLISCRNLMIYMGKELQKKLIPLFHYALSPGGILFLGTSESIGEMEDLFFVIDRKLKLYQRKEVMSSVQRRPFSDLSSPSVHAALSEHSRKLAAPAKVSLRELTEQSLLKQIAPSGALVNAQGDILYLHGRAGMYLELPAGESGINNILKMAREGLREDLTIALHQAALRHEIVHRNGLHVKTNETMSTLNLTIRPLKLENLSMSQTLLFLIVLEEVPLVESPKTAVAGANSELHTDELREKLRITEEYLRSSSEELRFSNEELKSSNEEMQSMNEELQSTNEELETSKEELQSVNEELSTVNIELQTKVVDLSQSNNDMNNLLAGTGVGTIFVDYHLHILHFTPAASTIINLIPSDIGRPIAHIATNLVGYENLLSDTQSVLNSLIPKEVEVQSSQGRWYTMRILPYRTLENVIEGAVITFMDVTQMKQTEMKLRKATSDLLRLAIVVRDSHYAIVLRDMEGQILAWNPAAVRMYGWSEEEALKMNIRGIIPEAQQEETLEKTEKLSQAEMLEPFRTTRIAKNSTILKVWITASVLIKETGEAYAIATTERLIGDENQAVKEVSHE